MQTDSVIRIAGDEANMQTTELNQMELNQMELNGTVGKVAGRRGPDAITAEAAAARRISASARIESQPVAGESLQAEWTADQEQRMLEHLPAVRYIARRIHERLPQHVELEELVSAGTLGLIDAFRKFDVAKQVQFRSYAQFRIRGAILDSLRTVDWSPRDLRRKGRAVEEAIRTVTSRQGRPATEPEVATELHLGLGDYQQLLGELKGLEIGALHVERSGDSGEEELAYVPGRGDADPLFQCMRGEMQQRLADAVTALPERERLVMTLYYYEELTMKEIGVTLGVVESRVSQIHASAVLHMRSKLAGMAQPGTTAGTARKVETGGLSKFRSGFAGAS